MKTLQHSKSLMCIFNDGPAVAVMAAAHHKEVLTIRQIRKEIGYVPLSWDTKEIKTVLSNHNVTYSVVTKDMLTKKVIHDAVDTNQLLLVRVNMCLINRDKRIGRRYRLPLPRWTNWVVISNYNVIYFNTVLIKDPWDTTNNLGCLFNIDALINATVADVIIVT